jgi:hypothetical protein
VDFCNTCDEGQNYQMEEKSKHGGKREGAGRKAKEVTETTGFRLNSEALAKCREIYGRSLNAKINAYIKRLAKTKPAKN